MLVLELLVVVLPLPSVGIAWVEAAVEVDVALAGRLESAMSVVYTAVKPVTFVQSEGGAIEPATKLTAAHCRYGNQFMRHCTLGNSICFG